MKNAEALDIGSENYKNVGTFTMNDEKRLRSSLERVARTIYRHTFMDQISDHAE